MSTPDKRPRLNDVHLIFHGDSDHPEVWVNGTEVPYHLGVTIQHADFVVEPVTVTINIPCDNLSVQRVPMPEPEGEV